MNVNIYGILMMVSWGISGVLMTVAIVVLVRFRIISILRDLSGKKRRVGIKQKRKEAEDRTTRLVD